MDRLIRTARRRVIRIRTRIHEQRLVLTNQPSPVIRPIDIRHGPSNRVSLEGKSPISILRLGKPGLQFPLRLVRGILDVHVKWRDPLAAVVH